MPSKADNRALMGRIAATRERVRADVAELLAMVEQLGEPVEWPTVESPHLGYLTLEQVAEGLGVSKRTVRRLVTDEAMPHYHVRRNGGPGHLLFRKSQIDRWMDARFKNGLRTRGAE